MLRRTTQRVLIGVALVLALVFAARTFVGDVYRVTSRSMNPTLWGSPDDGDYVFVTFGGTAPDAIARFDLVVVRLDGEPEPYVKRVAGLSGESVQVRGGDLFIDGSLLGPNVARPAPILLFELGRHELDELFGCAQPGVWSEEGALVLNGTSEALELSPALTTIRPLLDSYLDPSGKSVGGSEEANDLILETAFVVDGADDACGQLQLELTEANDRFVLDVAWAGLRAELVLWRGTGFDELVELARTNVDLEPGPWPIRFSNVDDHLSVLSGGVSRLAVSYDRNVPFESRPGPTPIHRKPRIQVRARAKPSLALHELRVLRDLVYTRQGEFGTSEPEPLGPDDVFLLGDASSTSRDSRTWGAVRTDDLLGRPRAVVWPLDRVRGLERVD